MTRNQIAALLLCGAGFFAEDAQSQSVDRTDSRGLQNGVTVSRDQSVVSGLRATVNAAVGTSGLKSSGGTGHQESMDFQSSGKIKYFGYTEGGSVEMSSSSGELTAAAREARIAANLARQNSLAPNSAPDSNASSFPVAKANSGSPVRKIPPGARSGWGRSAAKHAAWGTHTSSGKTWTGKSSKTTSHAFAASHVGSAPKSAASQKAKRARDAGLNPYGTSGSTEVFGSFTRSLIP